MENEGDFANFAAVLKLPVSFLAEFSYNTTALALQCMSFLS